MTESSTTTIARWTAISALFAIPFLALIIADGGLIPTMYFPFITGKNFLFRMLVEIALVAWIVLAIVDTKYRPQRSWIFGIFGLFVAWMAIANGFAVNPHKAFWSNFERMEGWVTLAHLFVLFVVAGSVLTVEKLWRRWWLTFLAASALVAGYGLMQVFGLQQTFQSSTRVDATLGNAIYLADFLFFALAIAVWKAITSTGWLRTALIALAAVHAVVIISTGTRGAFVGLVAAAGIGSLLWTVTASGRARKIGVGVLAALLLIVGAFYSLRETPIIAENPNLARLTAISLGELGTRSTIWSMAIEGIKERPVVGWGQEGFNHVFNKYYEPSLYAQEPWFDRAHNIYLDWAIAGGIPALLLLITLFVLTAWAVWRSETLDRVARIVLLAALAGYMVRGLATFDNLFAFVPLVMIFAFVHAHGRGTRPCPILSKLGTPHEATHATVIVPIAVIAGVVLMWVVNVPGMRTAMTLIDALTTSHSPEERLASFEKAHALGSFATQEVAEQSMQFAAQTVTTPGIDPNVQQQVFAFAEARMTEEIARVPEDARIRYQYALLLRSAQRFDEAEQQLAAARSFSPRKQGLILEQGILALARGEYAVAETYFQEAYQLDTRNTDAAVHIAAAKIYRRDVANARMILQESFGTTTVNHPMMLLAYYTVRDWDGLIATLRVRYAETRDASVGFQIAAALFESGRVAEARTQVAQVMADFPNRQDVQSQGNAALMQLQTQSQNKR